ncbi:interleukin-6 receptor subunit alpha [Leuresthes tenuis]|uniref:interleukin-6 receptor subunit alpha n=1 Tax=Leuresthes tenuis TaxID=355514 RepID=UPI003B505BD4
MSGFLILLCALCVSSVRCIFDGACPRKDPPPGVLVLSPGNRLVLTCSGHVKVNGMEVTSAKNGPNTDRRTTSVVGTPTTRKVTSNNAVSSKSDKTSIQNTVNEEHLSPTAEAGVSTAPGENLRYTDTGYTTSPSIQPTTTGRTPEDASDWEDDEIDTEGDNQDEEGIRVTRGIQLRPQWKWNKQLLGKGDIDRGKITYIKGVAALSLVSISLTDAGKYTCHHGDRETFGVKVVVVDPPESPTLFCYKKSPSSRIRCEWIPQKPITKPPNCYLLLSKSHTKQFQQIKCSYSSQRSRCWCALDHNEDELRVIHVAFLCVTSILGNATSSLVYFTPLNILKPDPPSNVSVHKEEGQQRRLRVTWNVPISWKPEDNFYDIIYELKYRPLMSSIEQVNVIKRSRSYTITDALPGTEYLIQLRTKEEYDGHWSEWTQPVYVRSWTAPETDDRTPPPDWNNLEEIGSGLADNYSDGPTSQPDSSKCSFKHLLWIPVLFAFLSVILAVYIFRHRHRVMSKLHCLNVITKSGDVSPSPPSAPLAPEGEALMTFAPQLHKDCPPSDTQEMKGNEEGQTAVDSREALHFSNTSYFFLQGEL